MNVIGPVATPEDLAAITSGQVTVTTPVAADLAITPNRDTTKQIIQGVSGVAGDVFDVFSGHTLQQMHAVGLVRDVTDAGKRLGFDPSHTYAAIDSQITIDGRPYMFPCNVTADLYWVNKEAFERAGQPLPSDGPSTNSSAWGRRTSRRRTKIWRTVSTSTPATSTGRRCTAAWG